MTTINTTKAKQIVTDWFDENWNDSTIITTSDENTIILEKHNPDEGRLLLIVEKVEAYRVSFVCAGEGDLIGSPEAENL